ncbi:hypothetical protein [Loigolactobacillus binensis]|uniref:Cell surface protein n=1 Tax=Loigolactobacillus binensis TaxID=2559922 RepID=A0ABW3EDG7_9LACO|nr:hypothetical protein [Loigolactobacillus binensis]
MANNHLDSSMSREELRHRKQEQLADEQVDAKLNKLRKKKKRRRHRKFWFGLIVLVLLIGAFFIWHHSRSSLTGSWVAISDDQGKTYSAVTDITKLSTLTIKNGQYTYTPNDEQSSATTGTFSDNAASDQATFDSNSASYTLTADNDQVTFTTNGSIPGLGRNTTITFVRYNSSEYQEIKTKITSASESRAAAASSASVASSTSAAAESSAATDSSSNKLSNALSSIKEKITSNSSTADTSSAESAASSSTAESTATDDSSTGTSVFNNIEDQVRSWLSGLGVNPN